MMFGNLESDMERAVGRYAAAKERNDKEAMRKWLNRLAHLVWVEDHELWLSQNMTPRAAA